MKLLIDITARGQFCRQCRFSERKLTMCLLFKQLRETEGHEFRRLIICLDAEGSAAELKKQAAGQFAALGVTTQNGGEVL